MKHHSHTCSARPSRPSTPFAPLIPPPHRSPLLPSLTIRQWLYLLIPQTLGAAIIDAGANFGIAYGMYHRQTLIEVWPIQHNTIAGDMAVTTFIQGILSFFIVSGLVHSDMRNGLIQPFGEPWPWAPSVREAQWEAREAEREERQAVRQAEREGEGERKRHRQWYNLHWHVRSHQGERHALHTPYQWFCGSDLNDVFHLSAGPSQLLHRWLRTILEGALLSAVYFLLLWPVSIAIVAPLWDGKNLAGTWAPEAIKGVYGGVLGVIMNPVCAMIALGSEDAVGRGKVGRLERGEGEGEEGGREIGRVVSVCPVCAQREREELAQAAA
ncbi:hypothetical protein DACRYDRAFT_83971, partial [Dacryopinax primogenitus]